MMRNAVRPGEDGGVRGVLRKCGRSAFVSPGGEGADVRPRANKRRKTVAWRDGEDVVAAVECTDPHVVFIDFDRTLCTTKSGSSPLRGSHSLDRELWGLVRGGRWDVRVVTRNSHVDDIKTFMRRFAAKEGGDSPGGDSPGGDSSFDAIPVHHVGKGVSKGAVIRGACDEKASVVGSPVRAVFVDDSAAELLDAEVACVPGLTRVLFSRVLA